ncbi:MAG TPA: transcription antitermination factor NusB [Pyrinomonadaceae bacterium]|jgi:N utilization substance protein B|nr:transcription antitermination factor NusB [Pyrinomonadaceae bacterium]
MGARRKARESALQMLFAIDAADIPVEELVRLYWAQLSDAELDEGSQEFATNLVRGARAKLKAVDERITSRAENWRISRMAIVDRNILRLAVYEFLFEQTPRTVIINEALEVARRFSTYEATQFINGILDAIKHDLEVSTSTDEPEKPEDEKSKASSV